MEGVYNINKPIGMTSHDVVSRVRRILHIKKVGHTGTLDPMATGVLPICVGRGATKLSQKIMDGDKQYLATVKLGVITDTQDTTGNILANNIVNVTDEEINQAVQSFVGDIRQIPPMYSSIRHNGKHLYELARKGIVVERAPRCISIFNIKIININNSEVSILVDCSKGTYIRTLCHDIGEKLGCGACMSSLVRTKSGIFNIEKSFTLQQLENGEAEMIDVCKLLEILKIK